MSDQIDLPASTEQRFAELQASLRPMFQRLLPDPLAPRTVLVVPSLSLDAGELAKITGVMHYEERMLCMLLLLRYPRTRVIFITSQPLDQTIIDYYLHLLPGVPGAHARRRLFLFNCNNSSLCPLTRKILERKRLLERLRESVTDSADTHMVCFYVSTLERSLALALNIPIYGCDPALSDLGSKSGSREVFRAAGIDLPDGCERLRDENDLVAALATLKRRNSGLKRAVVKLNEGFSGEGNALFDFADCPGSGNPRDWIRNALSRQLRFEADSEQWDSYRANSHLHDVAVSDRWSL